jgi:hypothetical protein
MQRELRDMVYEYALDLHTDWVLYSVYDDRYTYCNFCDEWFVGALSTKVLHSCLKTILLINKQTSSEILALISRKRKATESTAIFHRHFPDDKTMTLAERSDLAKRLDFALNHAKGLDLTLTTLPVSLSTQTTLILKDHAGLALDFLKSLSPDVRNLISELVITSGLLYGTRKCSRDEWCKGPSDTKTTFTTYIINSMPGLKSVAIHVPSGEQDYYENDAPIEMCSLIEDGKLENVRLLFEEVLGEEYQLHENWYIRDALKPPVPDIAWNTLERMDEEEQFEAYDRRYEELTALVNKIPDRLDSEREEVGSAAYRFPETKTVYKLKRLEAGREEVVRELVREVVREEVREDVAKRCETKQVKWLFSFFNIEEVIMKALLFGTAWLFAIAGMEKRFDDSA